MTGPHQPVSGQTRLRVQVAGAVQGVGFRPHVFNLARGLDLLGWVQNTGQGVLLELEGPHEVLRRFEHLLQTEPPPQAVLQGWEASWLEPAGYHDLEIRPSPAAAAHQTLILPDLATCPACRSEIMDPANRRYRYPFTNCTHCGPRYSIIVDLPYDRARTTMAAFEMCPACRSEFEDPADRRFHAQPNACPDCGPQLELWDSRGECLARRDEALVAAENRLREGAVLALKGLGGFQLLVLANHASAIQRLRERKHRDEKPFAVMFPDLERVRDCCDLPSAAVKVLTSAASPIVLLDRQREPQGNPLVDPLVAPGNPCLGVLLPTTPLHHLLLADLGQPVVATSGNHTSEVIVTDEHTVVSTLGGIADFFLVHNRPVLRHVDDSIVRLIHNREVVLRRARGYAPLPIEAGEDLPACLGVGPHMKNTCALTRGSQVFLSQHIGDLETSQTRTTSQSTARDLADLLGVEPGFVAADLHPDYASTRWAFESGLPVVQIQHHEAHVIACLAENDVLAEPALAFSWDGTGLGHDGTIWGGEVFLYQPGKEHHLPSLVHYGQLRSFPLVGGDRAARDPYRCAVGVVYELYGPEFAEHLPTPLGDALAEPDLRGITQILQHGRQTVQTSSLGRLFDAMTSLLGLRQRDQYEGQAPMLLEFAASEWTRPEPSEPFPIDSTGPLQIMDWGPFVEQLVVDFEPGAPVGALARRFHNALIATILQLAAEVELPTVVLTGGCFQNRLLAEGALAALESEGYRTCFPQRIPPNDGGVALGQAVWAGLQRRV